MALSLIAGMIVCQHTTYKFDQNFPENQSKRWGGTVMKWKLIEENTKIQWYIKRQAPGWIGLGFGDGMKNSDWVFINRNVTDNYSPILRDCSFNNWVASCNEGVQQWSLVSAQPRSFISSNVTIELEIVRPLKASGKDQDKEVEKGDTEWTWAVGPDYLESNGGPANTHGVSTDSRGRFKVTLALSGRPNLMGMGLAFLMLLCLCF